MSAIVVTAEHGRFYRELLEHQLGRIRAGIPCSWLDLAAKEHHRFGIDMNNVRQVQQEVAIRSKWFVREIHHRLRRLSREYPDVYDQLRIKTSDDLLRGMFEWLNNNGGIQKVKWNTFLAKFNPQEYLHRQMLSILCRVLAVISLLIEKPALIDHLDQKTERLPHRLILSSTKEPRKSELIRLCDLELADFILESIDEEFEAQIGTINSYLAWGTHFRKSSLSQRGEFRLNPTTKWTTNLNIDWRFEPQDEETLRTLNEYIITIDRKEIYEKLMNIFRFRIMTFNAKDFKEIDDRTDTKSLFRLSRTLYAIISSAIHDYGFNQLFVPWKESGGTIVATPKLASQLRFTATLGDSNTLRITDRIGAVTTASLDDRPRNTTRLLPLCIFILERFISQAKVILSEAHQQTAT